MKRISLFLILILSSCSSSTKKQIVKPSFKNFEAIKLGASASSMENELGPPTAITKNEKFGANDFWVYDDKDGRQIGAASIDSKTRLVTSITAIPKAEESEFKLDFLINTKYPNMKFEKTPRLRCHRDYFPMEIFYISSENGLIIESDKLHDEVSAISWTSPAAAEHLMTQLKNCEK